MMLIPYGHEKFEQERRRGSEESAKDVPHRACFTCGLHDSDTYRHQMSLSFLRSSCPCHPLFIRLIHSYPSCLHLCLQLPHCEAPVSACSCTTSTSRSRTLFSKSGRQSLGARRGSGPSSRQKSRSSRLSFMYDSPATSTHVPLQLVRYPFVSLARYSGQHVVPVSPRFHEQDARSFRRRVAERGRDDSR